jgi:hypothetical protein
MAEELSDINLRGPLVPLYQTVGAASDVNTPISNGAYRSHDA